MKVADIGSQLATRSSLNCFRPKVEEADESQPIATIENGGSSTSSLSLSDDEDD